MNPQDTHSYTAQPARKEVEFSHRNVQMEVAITETLSVLGGTITRVKERLTITHTCTHLSYLQEPKLCNGIMAQTQREDGGQRGIRGVNLESREHSYLHRSLEL